MSPQMHKFEILIPRNKHTFYIIPHQEEYQEVVIC